MKREEYILLYEKMRSGKLSEQEREIFDRCSADFVLDDSEWEEKLMGNKEETGEKIFHQILEEIEPEQRSPKRWKIWLAAASITVILSFIGFQYFKVNQANLNALTQGKRLTNEAQLASQATLILSDGSTIALYNLKSERLKNEKGSEILRRNSSLIYKRKAAATAGSPSYNTLITPNRGQYQIQLEDGTKVWLNAASSLRYPVFFSAKERVVEVAGEAYFEVAKNKNKPFKVLIANGKKLEVEVLGTHFNIQAYHTEDYKITLLEGSVKVKKPKKMDLILKEGQQVTMKTNSSQLLLSKVDTAEAMAWKNGLFIFNQEPIQQVMSKIARWYDVEVVYAGDMRNKSFVATISKDENLADVLKTLALTGTVNFEIKGRKVIVK